MMVQLELQHAGHCMLQNIRYLHLREKCILLVVSKFL
jgi:hypothetical protein